MNFLVLDTETTTYSFGNAYDKRNKLVCISYWYQGTANTVPNSPESLSLIQEFVDSCDIIVGFHFKFDLHWFRRFGIHFNGKLIWDILLAQFILNHQTTPYTSLEEVYKEWGIEGKSNTIKTEYWDKGIDTPDVPEEIIRERLRGDIIPLKQVYYLQRAEVERRGILPLITVQCQDILMLEEMEWNGSLYDVKGSRGEAAKVMQEIRKIKKELNHLSPVRPRKWPTDFISLLLLVGFTNIE